MINPFVPSWRELPHQAVLKARGLRWSFDFYRYLRHCRLCGRKEDQQRLYATIVLIPTFNEQTQTIEYECTEHGPKLLWNCETGEAIDIPAPHKALKLRHMIEHIILSIIIAVRFCWFLLYLIVMWKIVVPVVWWWRS